MRPLLLASALALLTSTVASADEAWRLFVADHAAPIVTAIDVETGGTLDTFELSGPASLYTTPSRRAVFAVQGSANAVSAISSGILLDDHGDHGDIEIEPPALIGAAVAGEKPVHFVEHDGTLAIFFDGEGKARVLTEAKWLEGDTASREVAAGAPHHGVAVPMGEFLLVSRPNATDATKLPVGIDVVGAGGSAVGTLHECPDLHGEATSGDIVAIACATGLLLAKHSEAGPAIEFLPYDDSLPEGKSTTLLGGIGMQYWLGNYGADKVVIIDPSAETKFRLVDLPARRVHFALDPASPGRAFIFTEDGDLHRLNVISGAIEKTASVTEPYSMDGEWSLPRPRIAVAGGQVAVSDPLKGVVHLLNTESLEVAAKLEIGGAPYNIVAVGGSGEAH